MKDEELLTLFLKMTLCNAMYSLCN